MVIVSQLTDCEHWEPAFIADNKWRAIEQLTEEFVSRNEFILSVFKIGKRIHISTTNGEEFAIERIRRIK